MAIDPATAIAMIAKKLYQYTTVDECTRLRVRHIFDEHSN